MPLNIEKIDEPVPEETTTTKKTPRTRKVTEETVALTFEELNAKLQSLRKMGRKIALGIDPGARYTGVSIRDDRGMVHLSSTYYRSDETDGVEWSWECADIAEEMLNTFEVDVFALEGVVDPTGFSGGKRAPLNPRDIMRTAIVVGAIAYKFRDIVVMVRPRKNGSGVEDDAYPECLSGRRPKDLVGFKDPKVATRKHEKSAYDVAGQALFITRKDEAKAAKD